MQVLTPTGYKDVTDLSIGDEVLGIDPSIGIITTNIIDDLQPLDYDQTDPDVNFFDYTINGTWKLFQYQSIYCNGVLTHVMHVSEGDTIYDETGTPVIVTDLVATWATHWDRFIISGDHSYIVDGLAVHNASRYAVNITGTVNWNGTNTAIWAAASGGGSGSSVPTAADDVFFDSASGAGTAQIITANAVMHSLDMTGGAGSPGNYAGTLTVSGVRTLTWGGAATTASAAIMKLGSVNWNGGGTFTVSNDNRSGGSTITTNSRTMSGIATFNFSLTNASQTTTVIADSMTLGGSPNVNFARGGLTVTSGTTLTVPASGQFIYNGTAGTTTLTYSGATIFAGVIDLVSSGTLNITTNSTSNLTSTRAGDGANTFIALPNNKTISGTVAYAPTGTATGYAQISLAGGTITNVTFTGTSSGVDWVKLVTDFTVTGVLTATGNAPNARLMVGAFSLGGSQTTTTTGATFSVTDVDFMDITSSGGTITGTRIGDLGGNTGITTSTPKSVYWVGGSGDWTDATNHWSTSSGGSGGANNYPLVQDTAVFDTNSFSGNGQTVTTNGVNFSAIDASLATNFTYNIGTGLHPYMNNNLYGNVTLSAQATFKEIGTNTYGWYTMKRGTQTFTRNGATIAASDITAFFTINNISGGTFQTTDDFAFATFCSIVITNGTLNPLGNFNCHTITDTGTGNANFTGASGKTLTLGGTGSVFSFGTTSSSVTPNGMNVAITDSSATLKTFYSMGKVGDNAVWGNLTITPGTGIVQIAASSAVSNHTINFSSISLASDAPGVVTLVLFDNILGTSNTYNFTSGLFFADNNPARVARINSVSGSSNVRIGSTVPLTATYCQIAFLDTTTSGLGMMAYHCVPLPNLAGVTNLGVQFIDSLDSPSQTTLTTGTGVTPYFLNNVRGVFAPNGISAGSQRSIW